jgi:uncharacterized small protein (DUF1192 family)
MDSQEKRLIKPYERRDAICASILSVDDLRKRDILRAVQAEIDRLEAPAGKTKGGK